MGTLTYAELLEKASSEKSDEELETEAKALTDRAVETANLRLVKRELLSKHVGFEVTQSTYDFLKAQAKELDVPMSRVCREAITLYQQAVKVANEMKSED